MARIPRGRWPLSVASAAFGWSASAQTPPATPIAPNEVIQVQEERRPLPPAVAQPVQPLPTPPTTAPTPEVAPAGGPSAPRETTTAAGGPSNSVPIAAGAPGAAPATAAATTTAPDLGGLLGRAEAATGVEVQRRNAIVSDPRVRGLRTGQYYALGDGAPYFPARLDLDTPVSKFYPAMIRDVRVIRGPYTSLLGPGFAFLDIATLDSPRATRGCGTEYGGVSSIGYQTNGGQINGLQVLTAAGQDWGFRGSYNFLQGNDYRAGDGTRIPASYLAHNVNAALGFDLTDKTAVEFKALRTVQQDLEFPGLFFDISHADTEAYTLRLTSKDFGPFDVVTADLWYNTTAGSGDTNGGAKQFFVNNLLGSAFLEANPAFSRFPGPGGVGGRPAGFSPYQFLDFSTSRFAERSIGYRLAGQWGNNKDQLTITTGTDLNVFGQGLVENIRFRQLTQPVLTTQGTQVTMPIPAGQQPVFIQNQGIPNSNSVDPGLFIEALLPIEDRFRIKSGGRMDWVRTSSNARRIFGNIDLFGVPREVGGATVDRFNFDPILYSANRRNTDLTRDFYLLNGFATAEFLLSKAATLFLGYGYGERAPTLTELYATGPFIGVLQQGTSRLIGDPNLKKERLNQFDVGLRYQDDWVQAGVSGFYAYINDYITYDANKLSPNGLTQVVFTNTDLATLAGTEMYLTANLTRHLSPFATLSYVQGVDQTHVDRRRPADLASSRRKDPQTRTFATDTEALPQIPPMETRLGLRIHEGVDSLTQSPRWQVEFATRIVNGQNNIATSLGELKTPGFTIFDIRGFWQVRKNWLVTAGVENIGDLLYREHLDPVASTVLRANTNIPVAPLYRPGVNFVFGSQLTY